MPRRPSSVLLTMLVLGAGTLLAGCSASVGDKTLNTDNAEKVIGKGLTEQLGGKVTVSCPDDVKVKKGASFECDATSPEGDKAKVTVVQKDEDGNISYSIK